MRLPHHILSYSERRAIPESTGEIIHLVVDVYKAGKHVPLRMALHLDEVAGGLPLWA